MNVNFSTVISYIQTILNLWSCRGLTLLGKITILESLLIPKIIHKASYLPLHLPETFIKRINQVMFKFIWKSKWGKNWESHSM